MSNDQVQNGNPEKVKDPDKEGNGANGEHKEIILDIEKVKKIKNWVSSFRHYSSLVSKVKFFAAFTTQLKNPQAIESKIQKFLQKFGKQSYQVPNIDFWRP